MTMPRSSIDSLDISTLRAQYANNQTTPRAVLTEVANRIAKYNDPALFIHLLPPAAIDSQLDQLEARKRAGQPQPLYGIPFAIKDNINFAHHPTTAACPAYSFTPTQSATVVDRLCQAGAILVGKTNLDQFATGLVGTRSPYGTPRNPINPDYIPGGSSSGSAVAVAANLVSFSLGTDTAGSGRVPAAFNNIVGLKPTKGRLSTTGVVPACRSLDCVSIFTKSCTDAEEILKICQAYDPTDPFSCTEKDWPPVNPINPSQFTFGVPKPDQLQFFNDPHTPTLYAAAIEKLITLGGKKIEIDFAPFAQAARLLYEGPWVAERYAVIQDLLNRDPQAILEITRQIISPGQKTSAVDSFKALYQLQALRQQTRQTWEKVDCLLLPTTGTIYKKEQIQSDPIRLNSNLGYYTNFTNLLDLSALALPAGFAPDGLPRGVTLFAPAGQESSLLKLGTRFEQSKDNQMTPTNKSENPIPQGQIAIAVLGAHLSGLPLNHQLTDLGATLHRTCKTAPKYRFYALPNTTPPKPALLRVTENGQQIELEIWLMAPQSFGTFVANIPGPLGIGTIELEDNTTVKGFLCEPYALTGAKDISDSGGWRNYLAKTTNL